MITRLSNPIGEKENEKFNRVRHDKIYLIINTIEDKGPLGIVNSVFSFRTRPRGFRSEDHS